MYVRIYFLWILLSIWSMDVSNLWLGRRPFWRWYVFEHLYCWYWIFFLFFHTLFYFLNIPNNTFLQVGNRVFILFFPSFMSSIRFSSIFSTTASRTNVPSSFQSKMSKIKIFSKSKTLSCSIITWILSSNVLWVTSLSMIYIKRTLFSSGSRRYSWCILIQSMLRAAPLSSVISVLMLTITIISCRSISIMKILPLLSFVLILSIITLVFCCL